MPFWTVTVLASAPDASWSTVGKSLGLSGDIVAGAVSPSTSLCLCGIGAWIPANDPTPGENFWQVDRSVDPTRLAGLRVDGTGAPIDEAITQGLSLLNTEGGDPDLILMDFASFNKLVMLLGAKVQYIQAVHDEVEVAFEGVSFQSAYGKVTVLADRSCPPNTAFLLTMDSWKLRSLGRVPKIQTYGMEGLEGLRVSRADALEIRIVHYSNLTCNAPGWNARIALGR